MASLRPQWPDLLDPTFRKIYGEEIERHEQRVGTIFNVMSSNKNIEKDTSASGLSKMVQRTEASAVAFEDETQGYDVTYTHRIFSKGTSVSRELMEDDQFGVINRKPKHLAQSKVFTREQLGADIFNYGFTNGGGGSAPFTAGDAVALFSSAHTRTDGGSNQSNTTTADLSENALEAAKVAMRSTLDDKGQLQLLRPDTLLIPPALEKEATILLNSIGRVGTANNDVNPYKGSLNIVVWDYLGSAAGGSDTAWFLLDSNSHSLNWFNREDHGLEGPDWDFINKVARWTIDCRWSVGWSGWRGVYGSKGDNS